MHNDESYIIFQLTAASKSCSAHHYLSAFIMNIHVRLLGSYNFQPTAAPATPPGYSLHQLQGNKNHGSEKEGYLLKKSEGMLKKIWQKRKCRIKDGILSVSHSDVSNSCFSF